MAAYHNRDADLMHGVNFSIQSLSLKQLQSLEEAHEKVFHAPNGVAMICPSLYSGSEYAIFRIGCKRDCPI